MQWLPIILSPSQPRFQNILPIYQVQARRHVLVPGTDILYQYQNILQRTVNLPPNVYPLLFDILARIGTQR